MEDANIEDFIIVLLGKQQKKLLETYCELKKIAVYQYCQQAIMQRLEAEVKT